MSQTSALVDALKKALKQHGKTYSDVAQALDLTETSVKRLFSENNFSLNRLEQVCTMLGITISDLVQQMNESRQELKELTIAAEEQIASDVVLLLIFISVINRWTVQDIQRYYDISDTEITRKLALLDRLQVIELLPNNHVKPLVDMNFSWLKNGPIQQFYQKIAEKEFFNSKFKKDTELLVVTNGMLSKSSNTVFQRKMRRLMQEFETLNTDDANLSIGERYGNTVVLAIRQWQYGMFKELRKKD